MAAAVTLESEALRVGVSPQGGAVLAGRTRDGRAFLRGYEDGAGPFDVSRAACFPMVPVCNRVEGNGFDFAGRHHCFARNTGDPFYIHGDGWLSDWTVGDLGRDAVTLTVVHAASAASPYAYRATQAIAVDGPRMRMRLTVENLGADPLPFGIGFHPYFPRSRGTRLEAPARSWWSEGPHHLPAAREPMPPEADFSSAKPLPGRWLNNGYEGWNGKARIIWPESGLAVWIEADTLFSRYMLYAPDDDRSFFCLEPMSHAPNALAKGEPLGLKVLEHGETLSGGFTMSVSNWSATDD